MPRILADLPEDDIRWLDRLAEEQGKSRAAVLREAVSAYRGENSAHWLERGFGAWKNRRDIGDAVECQREERASWTRAWDPDYENVRAEFSDLFDREDDRENQRHRAGLASQRDQTTTIGRRKK
ncbi:ribbon-helix-helix protein, CopG family [Pelagerythrobacter rhizovicinus]|uniref:Ribbon-helix-helix protein, CopG family n=1 Tax=Pelagerythrobacter rhizovicinus TaxID=2268576 RepID=A0A4Q2KRP5_9SPHN|nr:ribbon-helix-helix protein, CopG family [Pelagerythrobacter rhizovicinus]RXZ66353.1 ribbon-helix-helix protein, CopG family [Pelagerythrobacter rhizovicinus]